MATALVFLCAPRWHGWQLLHLHKEDGTIFLAQWTQDGMSSVWQTYTGYLHVVPRICTALAALFPPEWFAVAVGVLAALWRCWLSVLAYVSLRSIGQPNRHAMVAASLFIVVPVGQQEALGNLTNLRWFCNAALVLVLLGRLSGRWAVLGSITAVLCSLTDPLSLLLSPFALWSLVRASGAARAVPLATLAASAMHWSVLNTGARGTDFADWAKQPGALLSQLLVRGPMEAQFGETASEILLKSVGLPLALVALSLPLFVLLVRPRPIPLVMCVAGMYLLCATLAFADLNTISLNEWWGVGQVSRYAVTPAILIGGAIALSWRDIARTPMRPIAITSAVILVLAGIADGQGDRRNTRGPTWSATVKQARVTCADDRRRTISVPVTPQGDSTDWRAVVTCGWLAR